jgi:hypothetical protein
VILNDDIAALIEMCVTVKVMLQRPNVRLLRDIHIVTDNQLTASAIQQNSSVNHHSIADEDITPVSQFDPHEKAYSLSELRDSQTKQCKPNAAAGDVHQETIENVRDESGRN